MGFFREIDKAVSGHGHGCGCNDCVRLYNAPDTRSVDRVLCVRLVIAAALFIAAWILSGSLSAVSVLLSCASVLCAGYDRFVRAVAVCVREKNVNEDLLMLIVVVAAVVIGHPLEAAGGTILLQVSAVLRGVAVDKVRRGLSILAEDGAEPDTDELSASHTRAEEFIAHFARLYTPVIIAIAVVIAVVTPLLLHTTAVEGIYRALILMVIACPCALIVSVPLAYMAGVGAAARQGVRFRNTAAEDRLCRADTVVFDQHSALEGEGLRVVSVKSDRIDADVLLRIAAHACAYSDGEYAQSVKAAYQDTIYIELIQSFMQDPGRGITVEVEGVSILLGTEEFVREHGVDPGLDAVPETSMYLAIDGKYAGRILFGAVARPTAAAAVAQLAWDGDRKLVMLSEETPAAAEKFSRLVGVGQYYAGCGADGKAGIVRDLRERLRKNESLVFVGDAAKDAACFELADVGIAASDSDSADITAAEPGPETVLKAIRTAKRTRSIVLQNVIGVLAFKILVLSMDMLGVCPLWLAMLADAGAALAAVLNSMRALIPHGTALTEE